MTTYQWVCNKSITTGTTCEIGTAYPSGTHEFIPGFCSICRFVHIICTSLCVLLSFVFWSLYYQFFLLTTSDYHVGIFKQFFQCHMSWFLFVVIVRFVLSVADIICFTIYRDLNSAYNNTICIAISWYNSFFCVCKLCYCHLIVHDNEILYPPDKSPKQQK